MNASKRIQIAVKKASKVGMDRFLLRGDRNLSKQNHSKRVYQLIKDLISVPSFHLKRVDLQQYKTGLESVLPKKKRFSADGQNIAQNYTIMRGVVTI